MKISTKGRYGLRAMVDLATHEKDEVISLIQITDRQQLSLNYLEQVFASLRKGGLVKSVKGSQGGYVLARPAKEITVGAILTVLEGKFQMVDNTELGREPDKVQKAMQKLVWDKIDGSINQFLETITLEELAKQYQGGLPNGEDL